MHQPDSRPPFARRLRRGELIAFDCLAALAFVTVLSALPLLPAPPVSSVPGWAQTLVTAGMAIPLAVRRLWPRPVCCVVLAFSVAAFLLGVMSNPFVAAAFALYTVALTEPRRSWEPTSAIAVVSALGVFLLTVAGMPVGLVNGNVPQILFGLAIMGGTWTVGRAVRERRAHAGREAERAVTEERLRIARELHDVVAHSMSLIAVKAGIANHVAEARPEEARDALRVIETTSRAALTEMRHMLGVLRSENDPGGGLDLGPAPGLSGLPELAERAAMAGVRVETQVRGAERLPEGVGLSAYRIVQESITNVVKHAAPANCRVVVEVAGEQVRIQVSDDGPGHRVLPGATGGHGLIGMRERVTMYGGAFAAGPLPHGGFQVRASLPMKGVS
ncbi:sensor histidine kinase [Streptosporangium sp. KLBMP 9127]|nr:sensor histidine kinase [Streptosporangium sp. KLBMP 9127]